MYNIYYHIIYVCWISLEYVSKTSSRTYLVEVILSRRSVATEKNFPLHQIRYFKTSDAPSMLLTLTFLAAESRL